MGASISRRADAGSKYAVRAEPVSQAALVEPVPPVPQGRVVHIAHQDYVLCPRCCGVHPYRRGGVWVLECCCPPKPKPPRLIMRCAVCDE